MTDTNNAAQPADVLVDYEVYQEDELVASSNSLAHAEHYAEQYRQDGPVELRTSISIPGFHAVESALLSKLRAPVADERNGSLISLAVRLAEETVGESVTPKDYAAAGVFVAQERQARAALASAPVADERAAQEYGSPADVAQRIEQYLAQDGRMNSATQLLYEAMKALRSLARESK